MMYMLIRFSIVALCIAVTSGCGKTSKNVWEEESTTAQSKRGDASALWDPAQAPAADGEFIPLNDEDLRHQFGDSAFPEKELGDAGMPTADQFEAPSGELASLFTPLFFNTDEHVLRDKESLSAIHRMAKYLKEHARVYVVIEGHCDERGPEAYNLALGHKRAQYVANLLRKAGVRPDQVHTISLGKEHPFAQGHTPAAWSQNRRAHFRIRAEGK